MKLKFRMIIVLSSFFIIPPTYNTASNSVRNGSLETTSQYGTYKRGHRVHTHIKINYGKKRSIVFSYGYVEENTLYLYFNSPLEDVSLEVTNAETGTLIFSGTFTGTSLIIPLQEDGYKFNITIISK
ncbi:hypothetical protein F070042J6_31980 [Bacteroides sp. f07]|uniref:hypothetical protein n=1 Tax=Bacteroides sp. f07 TaxID=3132704 RepID=UPI0034B3BA7B